MTHGMTKKQSDCFSFIKHYLSVNGIPPSVDEMRAGLGLKSKSGVHRLLNGLRERGLVDWLPNRARSIYLVDENVPGYFPCWIEHKVKFLSTVSGASRREIITDAVDYYFSKLQVGG